jgi:ATP-dependent DNA helicase RecQ
MDRVKKLLKKHYGYSEFRKGQEETIESLINERDTLAIMPTGAGKSLCYQLPAMIYDGITIVISPLISLMKDQVDALNEAGINATYINSTLSYDEIDERLYMLQSGEYKLLYIAPERLVAPDFRQMMSHINISMIAIDEAHCVSQWGHDFRPSYASIAPLIAEMDKRPIVAAFTATATESVKLDILKLLNLNDPKVVITGFDRENLYLSVVKGRNKKDVILDYVSSHREDVGIIYCATRKEVDATYDLLMKKGYDVGRYHAGLTDEERKETQEAFIYDDIKIIVATNAFGMGIDKSNVRYVIHHNLPQNMEAYYQEAGRAGRDGEPSECILIFSPQDIMIQKFIIEQSIASQDRQNILYEKLQTMADYCHTSKCLREYILNYFGEEYEDETCDYCSNCKDDSELTDMTLEAQKIFSCIYRMDQRFGTTMVADVLKGSKNQKVLSQNFQELSTYGIMEEYAAKEIKAMMNGLIADEYLELEGNQYPVVRLKPRAIAVLKGKETVMRKMHKLAPKSEKDSELFTILKDLRKEISQREKVPPYIIFADSTLSDMSTYMPLNDRELIDIKGVGESKVKKYGAEFIKAIESYMKAKDIEPESRPNIHNEQSTDKKKTSKTKKSDVKSHVQTFELYKKGYSLDEIAKERDLTMITLQEHLMRSYREGYEVNLDDFIPEDYESDILEAIDKIGAEKLRPIKDELPDEVSYFAIKAVINKYKS